MSIDRTLTTPSIHSDSELALVATLCLLFRLTRAEGRALLRLAKYDHATRQEVHIAIADGEPATVAKTVDVVIGRLRRKLSPCNIAITTVHGQGFKLAERFPDADPEIIGRLRRGCCRRSNTARSCRKTGSCIRKRPAWQDNQTGRNRKANGNSTTPT